MGNKLDCLLIVAVDLSLNLVSIQFSEIQNFMPYYIFLLGMILGFDPCEMLT